VARREEVGGRKTGEGKEEGERKEGAGCHEEEGREEEGERGRKKAVARAGRDRRMKKRKRGL